MPLEISPFTPELVRHERVHILLGKKIGRDSIYYVAKKLELTIPESAVEEVLQKVKTTSDANRRALAQEEFVQIVRSVT